MNINIRRKRAVLFAATPASLSAAFVAMSPRLGGHRSYHVVLCFWLLLVFVCLAFAAREFVLLKREERAAS